MDKTEEFVLRQMTLQSEDVYYIFDPKESRFTYVNNAFEEVTRRKRDELLDDPALLLEIIHPEDMPYIEKHLKVLLRKKVSSFLTFRIFRPDGTERWLRVKVYPILDGGEVQYISGVAEDDTARIASIFNIQKVNGWKNSTLEILSHDLRGPIATVKMLASVIARKLPDNKEVHKLTELIEDISRRNIELIKSVLQRETLDTAEVEINKQRLDLVQDVRQALDIYINSQGLIEKRLEFTSSHEKIFAQIDSMKFLQVVNNLVSNAIKFTKANGHIKIHLEKLEHTFMLTVEDNGIGIPRSLQPVLFAKYTNAGREGLKGEDTVGLGMWIVKLFTEAHGGKVWFESKENEGSKFYVEIPLGVVED